MVERAGTGNTGKVDGIKESDKAKKINLYFAIYSYSASWVILVCVQLTSLCVTSFHWSISKDETEFSIHSFRLNRLLPFRNLWTFREGYKNTPFHTTKVSILWFLTTGKVLESWSSNLIPIQNYAGGNKEHVNLGAIRSPIVRDEKSYMQTSLMSNMLESKQLQRVANDMKIYAK